MNGYGNSVFLRTAWEISSGVPPVNTVAPAITGTAQEGETVTCSTGTWTGTPTITYAYQWKRNGSNIGSATNSTYVLVTADVSQSITCQVTATNGSGSASATSNTITPIAALDPDAQAFITAAAITNPTQQTAINTLVVDLKGYSIWTKMNALYPFVGGTASTHKFNLKDPRDLDAAFRLTFSGGITHSSNGITPNGINGFADTKLNYTTLNNGHQTLYSRSDITESGVRFDMGAFNGGVTYQLLSLSKSISLFIGGFNSESQPRATLTNSSGFFVNNRTASNAANLWRNGIKLIQSTTAVSAIPNLTNYIGAVNSAGIGLNYAGKNYAFASIGNGLTDTEVTNFYTAVQAFQTTLGRQV